MRLHSMARLHWVKTGDIKTQQVRASLALAGILLKAFWKIRLMCLRSRKCSELLPSIYFWFRGKFSEERTEAIWEPKFTSQQVVSHPSLQGICAWVTSGLFYSQKRQILCVQWLLQPLSSPKPGCRPETEQQNHLLACPSSGFQWHQPAAPQHSLSSKGFDWSTFKCAAALGRAHLTQGAQSRTSHHCHADFGEIGPGNYRGITTEQELHPK